MCTFLTWGSTIPVNASLYGVQSHIHELASPLVYAMLGQIHTDPGVNRVAEVKPHQGRG